MAAQTSLKLTLDLLGEKQVSRRFRTLRADIADPREFQSDAANYLHASTRKHFDTEGGSGRRGPWAPLSAAYREWKEREYPGRPILVLEGRLRAAATNRDAEGSIYENTRQGLVLGVSGAVVPYARAHQHGVPGRLHHRPVYDLTEADIKAITEIARKHLLASAKKAGFDVGAAVEQGAQTRHMAAILGRRGAA